jgi:PHD/YefM family antitoxin component YafN of YafNO toxin-antitoxin module
MDIVKSWIAQGNLPALIKKTNQTGKPMLIYTPEHNSILVGEEEWKNMHDKIMKHDYLMAVEQSPIKYEAKDPHQMEWQKTRDDSYFSD